MSEQEGYLNSILPDTAANLSKTNISKTHRSLHAMDFELFHAEETSTPGLTIDVYGGRFFIAGVYTEFSLDGNLDVTTTASGTFTAPITNPKIDLLYYDVSSAALGITAGSEGSSPSAPSIPNPKTQIPIVLIYHRVGSTSIKNTDDSTNSYIMGRNVRPFLNIGGGGAVNNSVINGDGRIQQYDDYTLVKDAYDFAGDRFTGMATGTAVSAGILTTVTNASAGTSGFAHKFSGVTLTGTGILYHRHRIESLNAQLYKNKTASLSVKVYHDVGSAKTFTLYVRKANAKNNFSAVTAVSNDGGTSASSATSTTLKFEGISMGDVSNGIELELKMEVGAITTKNVEVTDWQLELGSTASDFEYRDIGVELEKCKRYRQLVDHAVGISISAVTWEGIVYHKGMMSNPTVALSAVMTVSDLTAWTLTQSSVHVSITNAEKDSSRLQLGNFTGMPADDHAVVNGTGGTMQFSAEL